MIALLIAIILSGINDLEWSGICRAPAQPGSYYAVADHGNHYQNDFVHVCKPDSSGMNVWRTFSIQTPGGGIIRNQDWEDICAGNGKIWILDSIADNKINHRLIEAVEPTEFGEDARLLAIYDFEGWQMRADACFYCPEIEAYPPIGIILAGSGFWTSTYNDIVWALQSGELAIIGTTGHLLEPVTGADWQDGILLLNTPSQICSVPFHPHAPRLVASNVSRGQSESACFSHNGGFLSVTEAGKVYE